MGEPHQWPSPISDILAFRHGLSPLSLGLPMYISTHGSLRGSWGYYTLGVEVLVRLRSGPHSFPPPELWRAGFRPPRDPSYVYLYIVMSLGLLGVPGPLPYVSGGSGEVDK